MQRNEIARTELESLLKRVVIDLGGGERTARDLAGAMTVPMAELEIHGSTIGTVMIEAISRMSEAQLLGASISQRRGVLDFESRAERPEAELAYADEGGSTYLLTPAKSLDAVERANATLIKMELITNRLRVPLSQLLGLRNLSVLVSAVLVSEVEAACEPHVFSNPHQDGYPDLLPRTKDCLAYCESVRVEGRWSDKSAWTDPAFGGIEVKATCGNTPSAKIAAKPGLGEERSPILTIKPYALDGLSKNDIETIKSWVTLVTSEGE